MDYLPSVLIPLVYFGVAMLKPRLAKILPWNVCAICVAVSTTWFVLAVLWLAGVEISIVMLALLMGMSVCGLMYKLESIFKKGRLKNFWFVRLVVIVGGAYGILFFIERSWNELIVVIIASLIAIVIATFIVQGVTHSDVLKENEEKGRSSDIIKKLDNCC